MMCIIQNATVCVQSIQIMQMPKHLLNLFSAFRPLVLNILHIAQVKAYLKEKIFLNLRAQVSVESRFIAKQ